MNQSEVTQCHREEKVLADGMPGYLVGYDPGTDETSPLVLVLFRKKDFTSEMWSTLSQGSSSINRFFPLESINRIQDRGALKTLTIEVGSTWRSRRDGLVFKIISIRQDLIALRSGSVYREVRETGLQKLYEFI